MANLRIAELDFDQIKTNLKAYLSSQEEFTDYDYEGSGLSVLIDVLAYNTHYNAYLANMLVNEMFLDSAVKRSSVVSLAKHLGYTPRSARGARAIVDITVNSPVGSPTSLVLPRYTTFTGTAGGQTFNFVNLEEAITYPASGVYTFADVVLTQGQYYTFSYTVSSSPGPSEKYTIPNVGVDTTSIRVTVQNSSSDLTTSTYTLVTDISSINGESKVFFLQENSQGRYEVYFGDGVLGKLLSPGNIITIQYLVTDGVAGNVSSVTPQTFSSGSAIGGSNNITIVVTSNATGGQDIETVSSIKYNAPLVNAAKNRAVTVDDYKTLITSNFSEAESVAVWGGEDNEPPIYGKVIISLKPYEGFTITQSTKNRIRDEIIASKKVLAIQPEFVDPEYFYVSIEFNTKYNPSLTTLSTTQIESLVRSTTVSYFNDNLGKFDQDFYLSRLVNNILLSNSSIVSTNAEVRLQKRLSPVLNITNNYTGDNTLYFYNKLHPGRFTSSYFYVNLGGTSTLVTIKDQPNTATIDYNGTGTLKLYNAITGSLVDNNYGTINYATGIVTLSSVELTGYPSGATELRLTCELQEASYDITANRRQVLVLDTSTESAAAGILPGLTVNVSRVIE